MKRLFIVNLLMTLSIGSMAQDYSFYQKKLFIYETDSMPYRLLLPEKYDTTKEYPVVLFLHGAGERGMDNEKQLVHGGDLFLKDEVRKNFPAIIVFPQCPENSFWSNVIIAPDSTTKMKLNFLAGGPPTPAMALLQKFLKYILANYRVNKDQLYVGGLSMGGMGTFELVRRQPDLFAAAFSICGGANPATAREIKNTKWWIFHGAKDDIVNPQYSVKMVNALKSENVYVKFNLYPEANHNSWDAALAEPLLLPWLFSQHK